VSVEDTNYEYLFIFNGILKALPTTRHPDDDLLEAILEDEIASTVAGFRTRDESLDDLDLA